MDRMNRMISETADAASPASCEPAQSPPDGALKLDLAFIRNEILRQMVTGIATAKAEILGRARDLEPGHGPRRRRDGGRLQPRRGATGRRDCRRARRARRLNPADVIKWASWMGDQASTAEPGANAAAARVLQNFSALLTSASIAMRPEGPSARN